MASFRASFSNLPDDIVILVLDLICDSATYSAFSRVTKRLYNLALPLIYRSITLRARHMIQPTSRHENSPSFAKFKRMQNLTRHITITEALENSSQISILKKFSRLDTISWKFWDANVAAVFLESLCDALPHVRISLEDDRPLRTRNISLGIERTLQATNGKFMNIYKSLTGRSTLFSIDICWDHVSVPFQRMITSSSSLQILRIRQPQSSSTLLVSLPEAGRHYTKRTFRLRELLIDGPAFCEALVRPANLRSLRRLELRNERSDEFLERFQDVKWKLETVIFDQTVSQPQYRCVGAMEKFLASFEGLRTLHISGVASPATLIPAISCHGQTLQDLTLYERGRFRYQHQTDCVPLQLQDLTILNSTCPDLKSLTIDVKGLQSQGEPSNTCEASYWETWYRPRYSENPCPYMWNYIVLDALSQFRNIRHLTLFTEADDTGVKPFVNPSAGTIRDIYEYMRSHKQGAGLLTLQIVIGGYFIPNTQDAFCRAGPPTVYEEDLTGLDPSKGKTVTCFLDEHRRIKVRDSQVEIILRQNEERKKHAMQEAESREIEASANNLHPTPAAFASDNYAISMDAAVSDLGMEEAYNDGWDAENGEW